jgi:hypothetical protein
MREQRRQADGFVVAERDAELPERPEHG